MRTSAILLAILFSSGSLAAEGLKTAISGDKLSINGSETKLGAAQWASPENSWRTVGELMKTVLPPADAKGKRAGINFSVDIDETASWGALKAVLMAAAASGIDQARVNVPGKPDAHVILDLPGADPAAGEHVDLPLTEVKSGELLTENAGKKVPCTVALLQGLVKQLPKSTVVVNAATACSANKVIGILRALRDDAKAAAIAYLPIKQITPEEATNREEAKSAVDRAFEGGLGGLGK